MWVDVLQKHNVIAFLNNNATKRLEWDKEMSHHHNQPEILTRSLMKCLKVPPCRKNMLWVHYITLLRARWFDVPLLLSSIGAPRAIWTLEQATPIK